MAKRLRVGMIYGMCALGVATLANAQSTNVTIYGEDGSVKTGDTVITEETRVEGATGVGGSTTITEDATVTSETTVTGDVAVQDAKKDTVGDIEPSDVNRLERRREAKRFGMAGFGPAGFGGGIMDDDDDRMSYDVYLGRAWEVTSRAAIKSTAGITTDLDDNHLADLSLGANLYALPTDFSPYIGADLGLGGGRANGDNTFGFTAGASVGALLFRTANAQLNLEGNAKMMLSELEDEYPSVYSATIGVLF